MASKYDSAEEEEKETGDNYSFSEMPSCYGGVLVQRKGESPSVDVRCWLKKMST